MLFLSLGRCYSSCSVTQFCCDGWTETEFVTLCDFDPTWVTVESCVTVNTTESSVGFRAFLFHLLMLRDKQQQVCGSAGQLRICAAEREE